MKEEVLKMALEALEELTDTEQTHAALDRGDAAITAIKEVLKSVPDGAQPEPVAWHDKIMGMKVSMDVSTGDDDAGNRIFGRVIGASADVILAEESRRNFTSPPPAATQLKE